MLRTSRKNGGWVASVRFGAVDCVGAAHAATNRRESSPEQRNPGVARTGDVTWRMGR